MLGALVSLLPAKFDLVSNPCGFVVLFFMLNRPVALAAIALTRVEFTAYGCLLSGRIYDALTAL